MILRTHPRRWLWVGGFLALIKWLPNWLSGQDVQRKQTMQATEFGLLGTKSEDAALVDAWDRAEGRITEDDIKDGRGWFSKPTHDLTNLFIEWVRRWGSYGAKFAAFMGACFGVAITLVVEMVIIILVLLI